MYCFTKMSATTSCAFSVTRDAFIRFATSTSWYSYSWSLVRIVRTSLCRNVFRSSRTRAFQNTVGV